MMFNWRNFFGALILFLVLILIVGMIAGGFYLLCERGDACGYAMIVGGALIGGSIANGFVL